MNTIAGTIRTRSARRTLLAALLTVAAFVGLQAPEASASTRSLAGAYGGVSAGPVFAQRVYINGYTYPGLQIPGPYVTRSNGSTGRQAVVVNAGIEQWSSANRAWMSAGSYGWVTTALEPGQSGTSFANIYEKRGPGIYRVTYVVRWYNTAGQLLGMQAIFLNQYGDYRCFSGFICGLGAGWVQIY